jgi:hypothetical protein
MAHGVLLANPLQSSKRTFFLGKFPQLFCLQTHVQGVESQAFDFPDNFLEIVALTLEFALKYQYVADTPLNVGSKKARGIHKLRHF